MSSARPRTLDLPIYFPFNAPPAPPVQRGQPRGAAAMSGTGDRVSFDRLMLEHLAAAQRFATRITGDPDVAEDVVHDALLRAARSWQTFRGQSSFSTWLFRIVLNAAHDRRIAATRNEPATLDHDPPDARTTDPAVLASAADLGERIGQLISTLPARQRDALVLTAYENLSTAEAAEVMETSEQNVRTNVHLARQKLKQQLANVLNDKRGTDSTTTR